MFISQVYVNPYNFGRRKNWVLFLGMINGRFVTFCNSFSIFSAVPTRVDVISLVLVNFYRDWRHVLFPSTHLPVGNGLHWKTVHSDSEDEDYTETDKLKYCVSS